MALKLFRFVRFVNIIFRLYSNQFVFIISENLLKLKTSFIQMDALKI